MKKQLLKLSAALALTLGLSSTLSAQQNALHFDGTDDYLSCGNDPSVRISGTQITLEAWIFVTNFQPNVWQGTIINKEGSAQQGYMLRAGALGQLNFNLGTGAWNELNSQPNALNPNVWHHVAGTYDGAMMRMYIDGVCTDSMAMSASIQDGTSELRLGEAGVFTGRFWDGRIDEVRVWNVTRSAAEIQATMNSELCGDEAGLMAYYQMNEGTATGVNTGLTTIPDVSGNGNAGTITNFALNGTNMSNITPGALISSPGVVSADMAGAISSVMSACPGDAITLTMSGSLNDNEYWVVYDGGCDSTVIATTDMASVTISQTNSGDFYVRGEGGCADPGPCQALAVPSLGGPPATTPAITSSHTDPLCAGMSTTIDFSGTLNDNVQWMLYDGACGGAAVDSTTSGSFTVTPGVTTTYYIGGAGGACVANGMCESVTIDVISGNTSGIFQTITSSASSVCAGDDVTILMGGANLNQNTRWVLYSGSCGGLALDSTTANTFTVTQNAATTYFVRAEGGCAPDGNCASVTVGESPSVAATLTAFDVNESVICAGGRMLTFEVTGSLNDNDSWEVYEGSCGGTPVGTINGTTIDIMVTAPATYFVRAEGGCPGEGNCMQVSITESPQISFSAAIVASTPNNDGEIDLTVNGGTAPFTFDWDNDGTGDNDDTEDLTNLAVGSYSVSVTDDAGCTADSVFMVPLDTLDAIATINRSDNYEVYPNPAKDEIFVESTDVDAYQVILINSQGQEMKVALTVDGARTHVNLSSLASGIYFLRLIDDKGQGLKKVIIE